LQVLGAALLVLALAGAGRAQAPGVLLLEPRLSRLLPAPGESFDVLLEAATGEAAASGVALDLITPPELSLDLPEPAPGDLAAASVLTRRWRLSADRPGSYAVQARLRAGGQAEQVRSFAVVVARAPADLDTRGDRHPRVTPGPDGSFVFRNAHLVAVLLRGEAGYGPLLAYPATRPGAPWSDPVAVAPAVVNLDGPAAPGWRPTEAHLAGEGRLRLRGSAGGARVEVELGIGREPWLVWTARATTAGGLPALSLSLRAPGHRGGEALFPGVEWVEGDEERAHFTPDRDDVTIPLAAVTRGTTTVGLLWNDPAARGGMGSAPDEVDGGSRMDLTADGAAGRTSVSARLLVLRETPHASAAVRQWAAAFGAPITTGSPRSAAASRRLVRRALDRLWAEDLPGWSPAVSESPLPPIMDPRAVVASWLDAGLEGGGTGRRLRDRAGRVTASLREDGPLPPALAYRAGGVLSALDAERAALQPLLEAQQADGGWPADLLTPERSRPGEAPAPEAGLIAARALPLLRYAAWTGDSRVAGAGLKALAYLQSRFSLPRGAALVAFPPRALSLPAAAEAAESFLLGYRLTGRPDLLAAARRWADAGLPFVHFRRDRARPALQHATLPSFGALAAGDPEARVVQWTGLVYARVLRALAAVRPDALYDYVSEGIVASAARQIPTEGPHAGLLPESWDPATGAAHGLWLAPHLFLAAHYPLIGLETGVSHARVRVGPDRLHVASGATIERATPTAMRLRLNLRWPAGDAFTTVIGVPVRPLSVEYNSTPLRRYGLGARSFLAEAESEAEPGWNYDPGTGVLILRLAHTGATDHLEIRWPDPLER